MRVGYRECRAPEIRAKVMEGVEDLEVQAPKDSPAYGARNVQIVVAGTAEALPGPATCGVGVVGVWRSITDELGK